MDYYDPTEAGFWVSSRTWDRDMVRHTYKVVGGRVEKRRHITPTLIHYADGMPRTPQPVDRDAPPHT